MHDNEGFELHPQLAADSVTVTKLALSEVRLITDANYPWLILIPKRADIREIHRLTAADQQTLMQEIAHVADRLEAVTGADKMNVAALGNMVPQLHVHIIARFETDLAWPGPIWGVAPQKNYGPDALKVFVGKLRQALV
jgi:diadenosine tetraphosphate (Ap4A) HIT family hydrolase